MKEYRQVQQQKGGACLHTVQALVEYNGAEAVQSPTQPRHAQHAFEPAFESRAAEERGGGARNKPICDGLPAGHLVLLSSYRAAERVCSRKDYPDPGGVCTRAL